MKRFRGFVIEAGVAGGLLLLGATLAMTILVYQELSKEPIMVEQVVQQQSSGYEAEWRSGQILIRVRYVPPEGEDPAVSVVKFDEMVTAAEAKRPPNP